MEGNNRGKEGTAPVTTARPEAGKQMCVEKMYLTYLYSTGGGSHPVNFLGTFLSLSPSLDLSSDLGSLQVSRPFSPLATRTVGADVTYQYETDSILYGKRGHQ